jgi:hypothetical protein
VCSELVLACVRCSAHTRVQTAMPWDVGSTCMADVYARAVQTANCSGVSMAAASTKGCQPAVCTSLLQASTVVIAVHRLLLFPEPVPTQTLPAGLQDSPRSTTRALVQKALWPKVAATQEAPGCGDGCGFNCAVRLEACCLLSPPGLRLFLLGGWPLAACSTCPEVCTDVAMGLSQ